MTTDRPSKGNVRLKPWGAEDLPLLQKLLGDAQMMIYLGGPESPETIENRQKRYVDDERSRDSSMSRSLKIIDSASGAGVGWVGYWKREWRDDLVYEIGWSVLPSFQGRGIAGAATAQAIDLASSATRYRFMHAFPSVRNLASNSICRKLGFILLGTVQFEYPEGQFMRCNNWRLDLLHRQRPVDPFAR